MAPVIEEFIEGEVEGEGSWTVVSAAPASHQDPADDAAPAAAASQAAPESVPRPIVVSPEQRLAVLRINRHTQVAMAPELYTFRFGIITTAQPWGDRFWPGFRQLLTVYVDRFQWLRNLPELQCIFELPQQFSKATAKQPRSANNQGSGSFYAAWAFRFGGVFYMTRYNIVVNLTPAWQVHSDWLRFDDVIEV